MMAVYVDDMHLSEAGRYRRMKMSHMIADTEAELLAMADRIGVPRKWHQYPGTAKSHFDICKGKRALAVAAGATEIEMRRSGEIVRAKRAKMLAESVAQGEGSPSPVLAG